MLISQKIEKRKRKRKFINFFKSSGQFLIKLNDLEEIVKQLSELITRY